MCPIFCGQQKMTNLPYFSWTGEYYIFMINPFFLANISTRVDYILVSVGYQGLVWGPGLIDDYDPSILVLFLVLIVSGILQQRIVCGVQVCGFLVAGFIFCQQYDQSYFSIWQFVFGVCIIWGGPYPYLNMICDYLWCTSSVFSWLSIQVWLPIFVLFLLKKFTFSS